MTLLSYFAGLFINLTPLDFYFVTLSPFVPLPLDKRKGEGLCKRDSVPLKLPINTSGGFAFL